jgi:hypothetical protein
MESAASQERQQYHSDSSKFRFTDYMPTIFSPLSLPLSDISFHFICIDSTSLRIYINKDNHTTIHAYYELSYSHSYKEEKKLHRRQTGKNTPADMGSTIAWLLIWVKYRCWIKQRDTRHDRGSLQFFFCIRYQISLSLSGTELIRYQTADARVSTTPMYHALAVSVTLLIHTWDWMFQWLTGVRDIAELWLSGVNCWHHWVSGDSAVCSC